MRQRELCREVGRAVRRGGRAAEQAAGRHSHGRGCGTEEKPEREKRGKTGSQSREREPDRDRHRAREHHGPVGCPVYGRGKSSATTIDPAPKAAKAIATLRPPRPSPP